MEFLETIIYITHFVVAIALLITVLIQSGKGGGLGTGFGGASASATKIFGGGGTKNVLGIVTIVLAAIFMLTSLTLAYFASHADIGSVMDLKSGKESAAAAQEDQIVEQGSDSNTTAVEDLPATNTNPSDTAQEVKLEPVDIKDVLPDGAGKELVDPNPGDLNGTTITE